MANRSKLPPDDPAALQSRFGALVKSYRTALGFSQEELAWRARMHRTYLAGIECGLRNISLASIVRLVHALNISLPEFFAALAGNAAVAQPIARVRVRAASWRAPAPRAAR